MAKSSFQIDSFGIPHFQVRGLGSVASELCVRKELRKRTFHVKLFLLSLMSKSIGAVVSPLENRLLLRFMMWRTEL